MSDPADINTQPVAPAGPGVAQAAAVSEAAADATAPEPIGPYAPKDETPKDAEKASGTDEAAAAPKPPARPAAEVRADIVKERAALGASFDALRADLDDAVDAGRERVAALGRKAKVAAPIVGAGLAVALYLRSRARDKR